jgi:translation initiation factor IF-2
MEELKNRLATSQRQASEFKAALHGKRLRPQSDSESDGMTSNSEHEEEAPPAKERTSGKGRGGGVGGRGGGYGGRGGGRGRGRGGLNADGSSGGKPAKGRKPT